MLQTTVVLCPWARKGCSWSSQQRRNSDYSDQSTVPNPDQGGENPSGLSVNGALEQWADSAWVGGPGETDQAGPITPINNFYVCRRNIFRCYCTTSNVRICWMKRQTHSLWQLWAHQEVLSGITRHIPTGFCAVIWGLCFSPDWAPQPCLSCVSKCPGFGWDRVNFHEKPGRNTAGRLTQTGPTNAVFGITCHHVQCWVGELAEDRLIATWERAGHQAVRVAPLGFLYILLIHIVVICFLCSSVKLSLSRPMGFAFFFPFSSPCHQGGGAIDLPPGFLLLAGAKPWRRGICAWLCLCWPDSLTAPLGAILGPGCRQPWLQSCFSSGLSPFILAWSSWLGPGSSITLPGTTERGCVSHHPGPVWLLCSTGEDTACPGATLCCQLIPLMEQLLLLPHMSAGNRCWINARACS